MTNKSKGATIKNSGQILFSFFKVTVTWILFPYFFYFFGKAYTSDNVFIGYKIVGYLIGVLALYYFTKGYLLNYYVSETVPFIFTKPKRLIHEGIYHNSRHPLFYLSFLFLVSMTLLLPSFNMLLLTILYLVIGIVYLVIYESCILKKLFRTKFDDYKQNVPFIFGLKKKTPHSPSLFRLLFQGILRIIIKFIFPAQIEGYENIPEEGGALFISNHVSYVDPFFLSGLTFRNIRFLTTAEVFKKRHNRLFFHLMGSVPIKRFTKDPTGIRKFFKLMQEGYALGYFPEGKRSWDGAPSEFPDGTLRLIKKVPVPIIPVSLSGFYALWPRWGTKIRRAKINITFHPQLKFDRKISDDELYQLISKYIFTDEINFQNEIFSKKSLNAKISTLFWRCPACGEFDSLQEFGQSEFSCKNCQSKGKILSDHSIELFDKVRNLTFSKKISQTYAIIEKMKIEINSDTIFRSRRTNLMVGNFPNIKKIDSGTFSLDRDKITYLGKKKHVFELANIKQLHSENNKILHFVYVDYQVQIFFFEESPLKWEKLYAEIKNK